MRLPSPNRVPRRGAVLPLVAICTVALIGLVAMAIDLGMVAVARTQCQNAADSAAMAGARTINGLSAGNYNLSSVPINAVKAAVANKVFATYVQGDPNNITADAGLTDSQGNPYSYTSGQVNVKVGTYAYTYNDADPSKEGFGAQLPRTDPTEPYSAVQATVNYTGNFSFGRIFGINTYNANAQATAVHRPRDVMIIMDLSGSMRFQSLPGVPMSGGQAAASANNIARTQSMNPESVFPQFGHYSNVAAAALQGTSSIPTTTGEYVDPNNISSTQNSGPPICADWFSNPAGTAAGPGNVAFTRAPDTYNTTPGGDNYLKTTLNTGGSYATDVFDIVGANVYNAAFEANGYDTYLGAGSFNGYTQGPGYWGKTFWIWPPDPRGSNLDPNNSSNWANNGAKDWRKRFFLKYNTTTGQYGWLDSDNILWNTSSPYAIKTPGTTTAINEFGKSNTYTYKINYAAILYWLFNQSPTPFPSTLYAGRIRYYSSVPNYNDTTLNARWWAADLGTNGSASVLSDLSERFWKDYIDFVLGFQATGPGTYSATNGGGIAYSALIGNGNYFAWGTTQISQKPDPAVAVNTTTSASYALGYTGAVNVGSTGTALVGDKVMIGNDSQVYTITAKTATSLTLDQGLKVAAASSAAVRIVSAATYNTTQYISYTNNPMRPRHQFWFGPMTLVDYLGNYNTPLFWWPGNVHEAHAWACKVGIQTAIDDIQNNHPNDFIGLTFFSSPKYSAGGAGHHNQAVVPLGRAYQQLKDSLWFPPTTVTGGVTEITPYDVDMDNVPRANGGTAPQMGFMISYNQFSSSSSKLRFYAQPSYQLPSNKVPNYRGQAGGLGRKGANRLVIFETDGVPNTRANANIVAGGADSYYQIRIANPQNLSSGSNVEWPSGGGYSNAEVYSVVQQIVALNTASPPGYSTTRRQALVYCIGYGGDFDPANAGANQTAALTFLQTVMNYGNTAADTNPNNFPMWLRIYGPNSQRITNMQTAFTNIMQAGVQVSLIQ